MKTKKTKIPSILGALQNNPILPNGGRDQYEGTTREKYFKAIQNKNHALLTILVDPAQGKVSTEVCTTPYRNTGLHLAAGCNDVKTIDILLKAGANIDATNSLGSTPLLIACENGHEDVIARFIILNASLHGNHEGKTPLHLAASNGKYNATRLLLAQKNEDGSPKINPNEKDNRGNTPLNLCMAHLNHNQKAFAKTAEALLRAGADPDIPNQTGLKPSDYKGAKEAIDRYFIKRTITSLKSNSPTFEL
jgi:hypothetical protein